MMMNLLGIAAILTVQVVLGEDDYQLIMRQKQGKWFNKATMESGTAGDQNAGDENADVYSIIGTVKANQDDYRNADGALAFKLVYYTADVGGQVQDEIEWTQTAYIDNGGEEAAFGAVLSPNNAAQSFTDGRKFFGLGRSGTSYLDGTGITHTWWWNAVASYGAYGGGIPAYNGKIAKSAELYIKGGSSSVCATFDIDHFLLECSAEFPASQSGISSLQSDLSDEISAREAADNTLQSNIDAEAAARQSADSSLQTDIAAEVAALEAADGTLQSNIDDEETARIAADDAQDAALDTETTTRQAEDDALDASIQALTAAVATDVADLQASIDAHQEILDDYANPPGSSANAVGLNVDAKYHTELWTDYKDVAIFSLLMVNILMMCWVQCCAKGGVWRSRGQKNKYRKVEYLESDDIESEANIALK